MSKQETESIVTVKEIKAMKLEELRELAIELVAHAEENKALKEQLVQKERHIEALANTALLIQENEATAIVGIENQMKSIRQLHNVNGRTLGSILPEKFRQPQK